MLETRVLKYFVTIAREGSISNAAKTLHITQPTLSRQLAELERTLGKELFTRNRGRMMMTDEGIRLREYAEEIVELVEKVESELAMPDKSIGGDVYIGTGETDAMRAFFKATKELHDDYPDIRFHVFSGNSIDLLEKLDHGLLDFFVECELADRPKYGTLVIPATDTWGILMPNDCELAALEAITADDLRGEPIICSRQALKVGLIQSWAGEAFETYDPVATYNLVYNGALMVEAGLGYAFCYDKLIDTTQANHLCFRPISPKLASNLGILWRKDRHLSKASSKLLEYLEREFNDR